MVSVQHQSRPVTDEAREASEAEAEPQVVRNDPSGLVPPREQWSTAEDWLQFAGTWEGDDLPELLELVKATRGQARF